MFDLQLSGKRGTQSSELKRLLPCAFHFHYKALSHGIRDDRQGYLSYQSDITHMVFFAIGQFAFPGASFPEAEWAEGVGRVSKSRYSL
jgi:hypothetical protein